MANFSPAADATSERSSHISSPLIATRPIINGIYQELKARVARFTPAIISLLSFFMIIATVSFSFLAYLFVFISIVFVLVLLFVSLAVKSITAIAVVVAFSFVARSFSRIGAAMSKEGSTSHFDHNTSPTSEVVTNLKAIADETLNVLHRDYQQLRTAFPSLILQSGSSIRALFLSDAAAPSSGPSPYLSWWNCLTQVMNAIIEIDMVACRAIFDISGVVVTSVWSISGSILGLPDTPRDINSVGPTEPSGTSTSVSR